MSYARNVQPGIGDSISGNIIGAFKATRIRPIVSSVDSIYAFVTRGCQPEFAAQIAAADNMIIDATRVVASPVNKKDWDADEEAGFINAALYGADLIAHTNLMIARMAFGPLIGEDDSVTNGYEIVAQDSMDHFLQSVQNRKLIVPKLSVNLARLFTPFIVYSLEDYKNGIPKGIYMPFHTEKSLAELETMVTNLLANQYMAKRHAEKVKIPVKELTINDLIQNVTEINPMSEVGLFYKFNSPFRINDADTARYIGPEVKDDYAVDISEFADNTKVPHLWWEGVTPHDIWAAIRMFYQYEADNNPNGVLNMAQAPATNKAGYHCFDIDGNHAELDEASIVKMSWTSYCMLEAAYFTDGTFVDGMGIAQAELLNSGKDVWKKVCTSSHNTMFDNFLRSWFIKYLTQDFSLRGGSNDRTKSKRTSKRSSK